MATTALIHSDDWRRFDYGSEHPLRMERLGLTWRLMEAYGLTALPGASLHRPEAAPEAAIARYHHPEYIEMLKACNDGMPPRAAALFGLGPGDNPVFRGVWDCARLVAGGSMLAADLVARGDATRAFHFAGGLHHAVDQRASGFCYVNDAVLAIMRLREHGLRVAYVDIDAHHGDGVQAAFYGNPNVLTISTHERGERLFPGTGFVREVGEGDGVGYSVNLPLEAYTDTAVYLPAFEEVVPPLLHAFEPDVVVAQLGVDAHRTDPLTHLALDIQGFARAVARIAEMSPRLVALGGGGYDIQNVARGWTAAWAVMNGIELPAALPVSYVEEARAMGLRAKGLWDDPVQIADEIQLAVKDYVGRQVSEVRQTLFPLHRI
jgi:acetoin utilization protein AcuC